MTDGWKDASELAGCSGPLAAGGRASRRLVAEGALHAALPAGIRQAYQVAIKGDPFGLRLEAVFTDRRGAKHTIHYSKDEGLPREFIAKLVVLAPPLAEPE